MSSAASIELLRSGIESAQDLRVLDRIGRLLDTAPRPDVQA
ncbi:hypothetical protein AB0323_10515 [Arthrobacter sp. NPDC080031]